MSYDPTQQVPPPQNYPPAYGGMTQQPTYVTPPNPPTYPPQPNPSTYPPQPAAPSYPAPSAVPPAPATYTQYDAPSAPQVAAPGAGFNFNLFWHNLGLAGQAAGAGGVLCFVFFLFPWLTGTPSYNGFGTASGFDYGSGGSISFFPYVWLIFLGMLALIGMTWPLSQRRWFSRQTATAVIVAIAGVMAALELCFLIEVNSFTRGSTDSGIGAGFWLDFVATLAVVGVAVYGLVQDRKTAQLLSANPYQAAQYPGSQPAAYNTAPPQYPGSQPISYTQPPQYPGSQPPQYPGQ